MFRTPLCPSSGASQLHMQSLVPCGAWFVVSSSPAVSIIRSFSAAHAVSGPVWCLFRCVLQSCCVVTLRCTWQTLTHIKLCNKYTAMCMYVQSHSWPGNPQDSVNQVWQQNVLPRRRIPKKLHDSRSDDGTQYSETTGGAPFWMPIPAEWLCDANASGMTVWVSGALYGALDTHTQTEPTYGHKPHDLITNVNQRILS